MNNVLIANATRQKFSLKSFYPLVERLSANSSELLETNWKDIIRDSFALTPEQDVSLENVSVATSEKLQQYFSEVAEHVNNGGAVTGKIVLNDDSSHAVYLFLETLKFAGGSMFRMLRIAHCDADCRNWGWG